MRGKGLHAMAAATLSVALAFGALAGCGQQGHTQEPAQEEEAAAQEEESQKKADFNTFGGSPWLCTVMQGNVTQDMQTSVKDDFYLAVNKDWLATAKIPAGHIANTSFYDAEQKVIQNAKDALANTSLKGHDAKLARQLYDAFLDWDTRNEQGVAPAQKVVDDIASLKSLDELEAFICDPERSADVPMITVFGSQARGADASQYGTFIGFDPPLLGDPGDYREGVDKESERYKQTLTVETGLLTRLGYTEDEVKDLLDDALSVEQTLSYVQFSTAELMDPKGLEGYVEPEYTIDEIKGLVKTYPLFKLLESRGFGDSQIINTGREGQLEVLDELWTEENFPKLKNFFIARYAMNVVDWLDEESYEMYMNTFNSDIGRTSLEDEAYATVKAYLPGPLAQAYVETYDFAPTKERITALCKDAIQTYRELFARQDWLSDQAKESFNKKLDNMQINAVYPDKWKDYSGLDLAGRSYYECRSAIAAYMMQMEANNVGKPVDRDIWKVEDVLDGNAMYSGQTNSINIFLGILEGNFYQPDMTDEEMYASIGSVIFHELSHAFDPRGVLYDENGNAKGEPLWTEADRAEYDRRGEKLVNYFNNIVVCEGKNANGDLYEGEVIADISGIEACLLAVEDDKDFDYDQFFRTYAELWREVGYPKDELDLVDDDLHAPAYLRTNVTLQQFDEFLETYDIKEGDNMYLAPEDRILVWD
ncbi:MAG: M13 family metallopeptidase [Atopobiaceae bacterium]|nr:M13 family metallopeptidase [Atopobiaceae bacterium]